MRQDSHSPIYKNSIASPKTSPWLANSNYSSWGSHTRVNWSQWAVTVSRWGVSWYSAGKNLWMPLGWLTNCSGRMRICHKKSSSLARRWQSMMQHTRNSGRRPRKMRSLLRSCPSRSSHYAKCRCSSRKRVMRMMLLIWRVSSWLSILRPVLVR